jgi:nucleoside-diphosphate-sugar epimerase
VASGDQVAPGAGGTPGDPAILDLTRLRELDWAPRFDVRSGMERYLAWLRAGNPW